MATNSPEIIHQHQHYISTGREMRLPSTPMELATAKREYFMHKGLYLVESSIEIGRAMNESIIFTFGQSGAGKSSTLNHLFDMDLACVSSESACTRDVVYYVSCLRSANWEVSNLKISFVDVPGWGDGGGVHTQAVNMATIEKFITEHPHLGRGAPKCYPNIILIIVSANDNRPNDLASPAVLMLKAIRQLRIIDKRRHNVVIVMTNTMSISIKMIKIKQELYQNLCRNEFGFEPPFVWVENIVEDRNPPLKRVGDWTILPDDNDNVTKQPLNIFLSLIEQMTTHKDEVGIEAVSIFFNSRKNFRPLEEGRVTSVNVSDKAIQKWRNLIIRGSRVGTRLSEVTQMIEHYVGANMPNCKREQVRPLISELLDSPFHNVENFVNFNITEVQYKLESYILQDFELALIIDLFKVVPMVFPFLYESILMTCLIDNGDIKTAPEQHIVDVPNTFHISQGLEIPSFLKVNKFHNSGKRIVEFSTNISTETGTITSLSEEGQVIYPVEHREFELTFFIKEIVYEIYFNLTHPRDVKLKQTLQDSINNLPPEFQNAQVDQSIYDEYKNFFGHYGHFIIVKTSCGGCIEGTIKLKLEESRCKVVQPILQNCIETILSNRYRNDEYLNKDFLQDYRDIIEEFYNTKIKFFGGRTPLYCETIGHLNSGIHANWVESLYSIPLVLDPTNIGNMIKLPNLIECYDPVKGSELNKALTNIENDLKVSVSFPSIRNSSFLFAICENRDRGNSFGNRSLDESGLFQQSILLNANNSQGIREIEPIEPIEPIPPQTPTTRGDAADRARTNTYKRAFGGYPGSSVVLIKGNDNNRIEEVPLNQLQQRIEEAGDNPVNAVCFCPIRNNFTFSRIITNPGNNEGEHKYFVITFNEGKLTVGFEELIMRYKLLNNKIKEGFVTAKSLGVGDYICICNRLDMKINFTQITNKSLEQHVGCFYPSTKSTYLVVDLVITKPKESCFPGNASVMLRGGERVKMDELEIGDYVLSIHPTTGKPVYSRVYLWAHRDTHITATFLHITHPHGHLHISANHLILSGDQRRPVPADQLRVGDSIHLLSPCLSQQQQQQQQLDGKEEEERGDSHTLISVPVLHVHTCTQVGYYAPFTNNGLIVVDGIAASVYSHLSTHSQSDSSSSSWLWSGVFHSVTSGLVHKFGMHRVGHCVLTPVRVGCKLGMGSVLSRQMDTNTHIHKYCQWLLNVYKNI